MGVIQICNTPDWNRIKTEYVTGQMSLRKLSEKYNVSFSTIRSRAEREQWSKDRERTRIKISQKAVKESADAAADNAIVAARIKSKLLRKLEREIDALPDNIGSETRNSVVEKTGGKGKSIMKEAAKAYKLRDLAAAYKDLTADMQMPEAASNPLLQSLYELERRCSGD